jgi:hypothetical protein
MMRFLCLLFLVAVVTAGTIFVMENGQPLELKFFHQVWSAPAVTVLGIAYGLGMLTGWSLIGLLRRSFERATDFRSREAATR